MNEIISDRRANPRIEINGEMTYHTENSNDPHQGVLENLSKRGACIWIDQELPATSQLLFRVEAEEQEELPVRFIATLLHVRPDRKESLYGYGCSIEQTERDPGESGRTHINT
jgi:c-di-GMP-binding flagellar brake protein YcgR